MSTSKEAKQYFNINPLDIVVEEGFNSRIDFGDIEELANQIDKDGIINPIHVKPFIDANGNEKYLLRDGERRYKATMFNIQRFGEVNFIPAIFVDNNCRNDADSLVLQIQANEGKNFTEYEYGLAYEKLLKCGLTSKQVAEKVGKKQWHVTCCLAHLRRDERVQKLMKEGKITGADVRRIYQAYKDEDKAVKEIIKLQNKMEQQSDKRISLTNLKKDSKTILVKDTAAIKVGLGKLLEYIEKSSKQDGFNEINLSLQDIYNSLKNDNSLTIEDVINNAIEQALQSA